MSEDEPTTQEMLIDHLRRIIEYWGYGSGEGGKREWFFGVGDDRLMSFLDMPESSLPDDVRMGMAMSAIGVEARDRMGNPRAKEALRRLYEAFCDEDTESFREFMEEHLPPDADAETLQQAYAFEMLKKLDDMVDRGRTTVQEMHLLEGIPGPVDRYMQEATACFRYGFDSACISMCRAALEESLKHRISKEHGEKSIRTVDQYGRTVNESLSTLIDTANKQYGYLDAELAKYAKNIRDWGNDCLHGKMPRLETRTWAKKSLFQTRLVLSVLYQTSRARTEVKTTT